MKVAILVSGFVPNILGGTEIATYYIAKHLAKRGYEVHVITQREEGMSKESLHEGFFVHRCRVIRKRFLWIISYSINVLYIIRRLKPNLVHVKSISLALVALLVKKIFKNPYIIWAQGMDVYYPSRFYRLFYRFILSNANLVIAQTNDQQSVIQEICNTKIVVIPNGVDIDRFDKLTKEEARNKLKISKDQKIILFVGSLRRVKGVKYLIQAMKMVIPKDSGVRLILIGDGKDRRGLEKLTESLDLGGFIHFRGKLPNEQVPEYMTAADIFVLPSLSEGFPVVIVEAMASGLPIITTNVGGLPEVVHDNENGFIVNSNNAAEIAEKILLLLECDELRERIIQTNKCEVNNYNWIQIVDRLEQVYGIAIGRSHM